MSWGKEKISTLIHLIKDRPIIWDVNSKNYKDKDKKYEALEEVALLMGLSVEEIRAKWNGLRTQYSREKRRVKALMVRSGGQKVKTKLWFAYDEMESVMCENPNETSTIDTSHHEDDQLSHTSSWTPASPQPCSTPPYVSVTPSISVNGTLGSKRTINKKYSTYSEAMPAWRSAREGKDAMAKAEDTVLRTYGLYIATQLRKFKPRLQCKAKYQINKLLYTLEMESLEKDGTGNDSRDDTVFSQESEGVKEEDEIEDH